jgi:hypothetical protein
MTRGSLERGLFTEVSDMPGASTPAMLTLFIARLVVLFLVAMLYLGKRPKGRYDDSDPRPRRRY